MQTYLNFLQFTLPFAVNRAEATLNSNGLNASSKSPAHLRLDAEEPQLAFGGTQIKSIVIDKS